ncbi:uncharacterized protein LOC103505813 [Diaphorina citri]|uniref:DNA repair nuclease/redox regulator APEX1 n=1 Tax=Diaphorina citri TaxID=121845 RepID=A0A3Q0IKY5_DIACI|nr:uncharacterized protein LOC103505813 [Diaphorina citri]
MGPKKAAAKVVDKEEKSSKKRKSEVEDSDANTKKTKSGSVENKATGPMNEKLSLNKIDYSCNKKNKLGEEPNFKIASWNVAGLRACVKKEGLDYIKKEDADIFCLQETKCHETQLPPEVKMKFPEYKTYWLSSPKAGYAGVGLYTKVKPNKVTYGLGTKNEHYGRNCNSNIFVLLFPPLDVPNAGAGLKTLDKRLEWDKLFHEHLVKLDAEKPVILIGDLNVSHKPIDLANPTTNTRSAGFTIEERDSFSSLLDKGFTDSFRHLYPKRTGAYTYWSYMSKTARSRNTGWRLDYFVVSNRLMDNVCDNVIRNNIHGSDHCPIVLHLNI